MNILPATLGSAVYSVSNRNEYHMLKNVSWEKGTAVE
jgi:hypothetical protein